MKKKIRLDMLWYMLSSEGTFNKNILTASVFPYYSFFKLLIVSSGFRAVFIIRLAKRLDRVTSLLSYPFYKYLSLVNHISVSKSVIIEGGLRLPHPTNIIISAAYIGKMVTIGQNVTIGGNFGKRDANGNKWPSINEFSVIAAGVVIGGPVIVGMDVIVGANSVIVRDVDNHSIVAGNPAKIVKVRSDESNVGNPNIDKKFSGIGDDIISLIRSF
jgi:serine O-acetyltransferase